MRKTAPAGLVVGKVVGSVPDDKNNHGIKAVIYGLVNQFGYVNRNSGKAKSKRSIYFGERRMPILQEMRR